jgi:hypothetical protein
MRKIVKERRTKKRRGGDMDAIGLEKYNFENED